MLQVANIAEAACIGCAACLKACPTGAIVGAPKYLHTVAAELCTGCNACVEVCPVPCITLEAWPQASHPLQGTPEALQCAEVLSAAHSARKAVKEVRQSGNVRATEAPDVPAPAADLLAKALAARQKSEQKYQKMGPLKRPRALR